MPNFETSPMLLFNQVGGPAMSAGCPGHAGVINSQWISLLNAQLLCVCYEQANVYYTRWRIKKWNINAFCRSSSRTVLETLALIVSACDYLCSPANKPTYRQMNKQECQPLLKAKYCMQAMPVQHFVSPGQLIQAVSCTQKMHVTLTLELCLGSKAFRFWQKTDEMTKTGSRGKNINFWRNWRNLGFVVTFLTKVALFDECSQRKNASKATMLKVILPSLPRVVKNGGYRVVNAGVSVYS